MAEATATPKTETVLEGKVETGEKVETKVEGEVTPAAKVEVTPEPKVEAKPATEKQEKQETGTPEGAPEKYELTLPEASPFSVNDVAMFESEARTLGLTNEAAQTLVDARVATVKAAGAKFYAELEADPEVGGDKLDESITLAKKAKDYLFPPDSEDGQMIESLFRSTGIGNHKTLVRGLSRLGRLLSEDTVASRVAGGGAEKTAAFALYGKD